MNTNTKPPERSCEGVGELLSWYANGTLGPADRVMVETHLSVCQGCRTTLALERRIVEGMRAPRDNVEQSPHAGWQKLVARLDAAQLREDELAGVPSAHSPTALDDGSLKEIGAVRTRRVNWSAALGAAVAVQAAAIAVLAVALVRHRQEGVTPQYHTLSSADPTLAATGPLVRIAFDSSVDETAARSVAAEAQARIIAGPSPDNVYTFVLADDASRASTLDRKVNGLRRQAHVLLVEPVVVDRARTEK